jgi:DNA-directed RNA polymerase
MKFFQRCAAILAHERKGLQWVSPVGLPILHKYTEYETKRVELFLYDKSVPINEATSRDKVDGEDVFKYMRANIRTKPSEHINKDKAKSAVAPNVIHSMDAAHLMLAVLEARSVGINDFALIHDSFGTHAGNTTPFFRIIRESFVDLYENYDPYTEIEYQTRRALNDKAKIPAPPKKGTLDLNGVIDSLYAFA